MGSWTIICIRNNITVKQFINSYLDAFDSDIFIFASSKGQYGNRPCCGYFLFDYTYNSLFILININILAIFHYSTVEKYQYKNVRIEERDRFLRRSERERERERCAYTYRCNIAHRIHKKISLGMLEQKSSSAVIRGLYL